MLALVGLFFACLGSILSAEPDCFHLRVPFDITNTGAVVQGLQDVQLLVDTSTLLADGNISSCADLRFRQARTDAYLDFFLETACDTVNTRIWVTVDFSLALETVYMYHTCLTVEGVSETPHPTNYGQELSWSGNFVVFQGKGSSCGGSWTGNAASEYLMQMRAGIASAAVVAGTFYGHTHSTATILANSNGWAHVRSDGTTRPAPTYTHTHGLTELNQLVKDGNEKTWPPYRDVALCESRYLVLADGQGFIADTTSYGLFEKDVEDLGGSTTDYAHFNEFDDLFIRVNTEANIGNEGGTGKHKHRLWGNCDATPNQFNARWLRVSGGCSQEPTGDHRHNIAAFDTEDTTDANYPRYLESLIVEVTPETIDDPYSYVDSMVLWTSAGMPPKGFVDAAAQNSKFDLNYIFGAAATDTATSYIPDLNAIGHHLKSNLNPPTTANQECFYTTSQTYMASPDHDHPNFNYATSTPHDPSDTKRLEIRPIRYVANRYLDGISQGQTVEIRPLFWCWQYFALSPSACSSHGTCITWNMCSCTNHLQWTGTKCNTPVCDGYVAGSPGECSDNGTCVSYDFCTCDDTNKYTGNLCQLPVCWSETQGAAGACSGNGECVAYNDCDCYNEMQYTGTQCNVPVCDGYVAGAPGECSDNGTCTAFDSCLCDDDNMYTGNLCQLPVCWSEAQGSPGACSGNGECVAYNDCDCYNEMQYTGTQCNVPVCDGFVKGTLGECNYNGTCASFDVCTCDDTNRYTGNLCQIPVCDFIPQGSPGACNDNGTCVAYDYCECDNDLRYTGQFCDIPFCDGIVQGSGACSDNGTCAAYDYCECDDAMRYVGQFCEIPVCDGIAQGLPGACSDNGTCVAYDYCECDNDQRYVGQFCEIPVCDGIAQGLPGACSDNGTCIAYDYCECSDAQRYVGQFCEIPVCNGVPQGPGSCNDNGTCVAYDYCECDNLNRYRGQFCQIPVCDGHVQGSPGACSDNGTCVAHDYCECSDAQRYVGQFCEIPVCDGITQGFAGACSDNGTCVADDYCECDNIDRYTGQFCQIPVCDSKPQGTPGSCSDNGTCIAFDYCECSDAQRYVGQFCELPVCDGITQGFAGACSDNGTCVAYDYCECDNDQRYTGQFCEIPVCDGIAQGLPGACSDNGTCIAYDYCECDNLMRYTGQFCEIPVCDGITQGNGGVCSDNGTCVAFDYCECDNIDRYTGQFCEVPVCDSKPQGTPGSCSDNGTCVAFDYCECDNVMRYTGQFCELPVCDGIIQGFAGVCSDNGTCVAFDYCECENDQQYVGQFCELPVCFGNPQFEPDSCFGEGTCVAYDDCDCANENKYRGTNCDIPVCETFDNDDDEVCNDRNGTCQHGQPPICSCNDHHYGDFCHEDYMCNGRYWYEYFACTNHTRGDCTLGTCDCYNGYAGPNCEYQVCFGKESHEGDVCSKHGECTEPNGCRCIDQWHGLECESMAMCGGFLFNNPLVCRTRGRCTTSGCECEDAYSGTDCEVAPCFGIPSSDETVCNSAGICWDIDSCMCNRGYFGRECREHFSVTSVLLEGWEDDPYYLVNVPYRVPSQVIPPNELPWGTLFNCTSRLFTSAMVDVVGPEAWCTWLSDETGNYSDSVNVTLPPAAPLLTKEYQLGRGKRFEVEFNLLTTDILLLPASVTFVVEIKEHARYIVESIFDATLLVGILIPVFIVLVAAIGVAVGVWIFFVQNKKKSDAAEEAMLAKMTEFAKMNEMFAADREKLELAIRLQKMKAQAAVPLPDEFVQLTAFDDDNQCVLLDPIPEKDKTWRRSASRKCVFRGHKLIMRQLDISVKQVTRKAVNHLVSRSSAFAAVPPHENVRRYHAYMVEGKGLGTVTKQATAPKLLMMVTDELEKEAVGSTEDAPDHGFIMEELNAGSLLDHMWNERRDAASALQGVTILSGVQDEEKLDWLLQAARGLKHCHDNGFYFKVLNAHSLILHRENEIETLKIDLPFLTRDLIDNAFAAPEVILESESRRLPERELEEEPLSDAELQSRADVYSFGIIMYCVLTETKRPYRHLKYLLGEDDHLGLRVAMDENFRPSLQHPLLRSWSMNLLIKCFQMYPEDRLSVDQIVGYLESIHDVLKICEDVNIHSESSESSFEDSEAEENEHEAAAEGPAYADAPWMMYGGYGAFGGQFPWFGQEYDQAGGEGSPLLEDGTYAEQVGYVEEAAYVESPETYIGEDGLEYTVHPSAADPGLPPQDPHMSYVGVEGAEYAADPSAQDPRLSFVGAEGADYSVDPNAQVDPRLSFVGADGVNYAVDPNAQVDPRMSFVGADGVDYSDPSLAYAQEGYAQEGYTQEGADPRLSFVGTEGADYAVDPNAAYLDPASGAYIDPATGTYVDPTVGAYGEAAEGAEISETSALTSGEVAEEGAED